VVRTRTSDTIDRLGEADLPPGPRAWCCRPRAALLAGGSGGKRVVSAYAAAARHAAASTELIGIKIISVLVGTEVTFVGEINYASMWLIDASAEAWLVSIPTQSL